MLPYIQKLKYTSLFHHMSLEDIDSVLTCLSAQRRYYKKAEPVFYSGDTLSNIGIVMSGSLHIMKEDYWGNSALIARIGQGEVFGEVFASLNAPIGFDIKAAQDSEVLFVGLNKILTVCPSSCHFHQRLLKNLITLLAEKNLELTKKTDILSQRSIRSKLLEYLFLQKQFHGSNCFDIPFNRQQLADYISVDRSSMTVELSKMQKEGILRFYKNHFELL